MTWTREQFSMTQFVKSCFGIQKPSKVSPITNERYDQNINCIYKLLCCQIVIQVAKAKQSNNLPSSSALASQLEDSTVFGCNEANEL